MTLLINGKLVVNPPVHTTTIVRQVNLKKDIDLFAIYKTQYYLFMVSNFHNNPDGER